MGCQQVLASGRPVSRGAVHDTSHTHLEPTVSAPRAARAFVGAHLPDDLPAESAETLLVLTSELVTNAVLHARTPLVVGVTVAERVVMVTTADDDPEMPVVSEQPAVSDGGRGVWLVAQLADDWGALPRVDGKTVWCSVRR